MKLGPTTTMTSKSSSNGPPSTTTVSSVFVQAGDCRIVLGILKVGSVDLSSGALSFATSTCLVLGHFYSDFCMCLLVLQMNAKFWGRHCFLVLNRVRKSLINLCGIELKPLSVNSKYQAIPQQTKYSYPLNYISLNQSNVITIHIGACLLV